MILTCVRVSKRLVGVYPAYGFSNSHRKRCVAYYFSLFSFFKHISDAILFQLLKIDVIEKQNKDARSVRPYLTSVFHHSWQLYSVLYSSTFDHCVERSQSATMTFPSWLMMDHDLPFSIFVSPSEKSVIQL